MVRIPHSAHNIVGPIAGCQCAGLSTVWQKSVVGFHTDLTCASAELALTLLISCEFEGSLRPNRDWFLFKKNAGKQEKRPLGKNNDLRADKFDQFWRSLLVSRKIILP